MRPRVSRDGNWLAFLRVQGGFNGLISSSIWLRNVQTGQEQLLFHNNDGIACYDWTLNGTALVMDYGCGIGLLDTNGSFLQLLATDCYEEAPVVNPVDGRIAFHDVNPSDGSVDGLYVASRTTSNPKLIVSTVPGASWPEWSPGSANTCLVCG